MDLERDEVFRHALELDLRERAELLTLLIVSLDSDSESDVEEPWMKEIDRSVEQLDDLVFDEIA
jgi:hypothetical protein